MNIRKDDKTNFDEFQSANGRGEIDNVHLASITMKGISRFMMNKFREHMLGSLIDMPS